MPRYTFKTSGVRKSDHLLKTFEAEFDAGNVQSATQHVLDHIISDTRATYLSLEFGELRTDKTVAIYDYRRGEWTIGNVDHDDRPVFQGYTRNQMKPAFDMVKNAEHWKNPIDAIVPKDTDTSLICAAIGFFAGSVAEVEEVSEGYRITANGYFVDIGA